MNERGSHQSSSPPRTTCAMQHTCYRIQFQKAQPHIDRRFVYAQISQQSTACTSKTWAPWYSLNIREKTGTGRMTTKFPGILSRKSTSPQYSWQVELAAWSLCNNSTQHLRGPAYICRQRTASPGHFPMKVPSEGNPLSSSC